MKIQRNLFVLRRHLVLLIVTLIIGGMAGLGTAFMLPPSYTARTELFVSVPTSGDPYEMRMASDFIKERIQTYVGMVGSKSVLEPVVSDLDLNTTPENLAGQVDAYSDPETVLITVQARAAGAQDAARLSTAVARSLTDRIEHLEDPEKKSSAAIDLVEANAAVPPPDADGIPRWTFIPIGALLGLAIGIVVATVRGTYDNVIRTKEDLSALTSAPLLASVPEDRGIAHGTTRGGAMIGSARSESVLRLRTNLRFAQVDENSTVVLLSSAQQGEGKTTLSIDLAIASARAGLRVVLVDADLRRPQVASRLGLENSAGLTTALLGGVDLGELLQPWGENDLSILATGELPPNPTELLETRAMVELVSELARRFDLVVLDGPPLLPVADGLVLSRLVSRVIFVAAAGHVKSRAVAESVRALDELHAPIGLVLNRAEMTTAEVDRNRVYGVRHGRPGDRASPDRDVSVDSASTHPTSLVHNDGDSLRS